MKKINHVSFLSVAALAGMLLLASPLAALAATTPTLGLAATYGVLASTYTDTSGATTVNGDVGFTTPPGSAIGGAHTNYGAGAPYSSAGTAQGAALAALAAEGCTFTFGPGGINLSTDSSHGTVGVYAPGVYCSTGAMNVAGPLTFSGNGTYIFRTLGALTSTSGSVVTLGTASACNVFWTPTAATTLAANTTFAGTVIDDAGITVGANTTWTGRALAFGGTVTTATDTITVPTCTTRATGHRDPPSQKPAILHVIKLIVNGNGGTAIPANFIVHVKGANGDVAGSPAAGTSVPGTEYALTSGYYTVSEEANLSYIRGYSGDCDSNGDIAMPAGSDKICTIINTDIPLGIGRIVPLIGIVKVPTPLSLPNGAGSVVYEYTVWNVGGLQALVNVTVTDDKCGPIALLSGDVNQNSKLDVTERWKYSCTMILGSTTTNTAVATGYGDDPYRVAAIATAIATVVVGAPVPPPLINVIKIPSRLTPFQYGGGFVKYTYTVTNPGVIAMNNVSVTDDKCAPVYSVSGDTNQNGLLDPDESWEYACDTTITVSTRNIATAKGSANGFTALGYAFATVLVDAPGLPNTGTSEKSMPRNIIILTGIFAASLVIYYVARKRHAAKQG